MIGLNSDLSGRSVKAGKNPKLQAALNPSSPCLNTQITVDIAHAPTVNSARKESASRSANFIAGSGGVCPLPVNPADSPEQTLPQARTQVIESVSRAVQR
jgi:hypothetical protein